MKKTLNVFNHYHNGDIFYSRSLVQQLIKKYNVVFYHNLNLGLFKDLTEVTEIIGIPVEFNPLTFIDGDNINSWLGANGHNNPTNGCSFYSYLNITKKVCDNFEIDSNDITLPKIKYENLENQKKILDIILDYKVRYDVIVLISSGPVLSGQSENFDFWEIINVLSNTYKKVLFITTTKFSTQNENVVYSGNITNVYPDLLEISYISSFCDIIVGRSSGPYSFSQTHENMNDENKTFISFCNLEIEGKFYNESKSKKIWSNNYEFRNVLNMIDDEIKKKSNK
jgi:hypothetical protein